MRLLGVFNPGNDILLFHSDKVKAILLTGAKLYVSQLLLLLLLLLSSSSAAAAVVDSLNFGSVISHKSSSDKTKFSVK